MKHIKKYESFTFGSSLIVFGAAAIIKIIYNTIKRSVLIKGIKDRDIDKLEYLTNQWKVRKK